MRGGTSVRIIEGDAVNELARLPSASVDLIVTSPPYADSRKDTYGGVDPDKYVEWFAPIGEELLRVLKPSGTFVLNIKERVVAGERHTYVLELIQALACARLALDRGVRLAQKEFLSRQMAEPLSRWLGAIAAVQQEPQVCHVPGRRHGAGWRLGRHAIAQIQQDRSTAGSISSRQWLRQEYFQLGRP